MNERKRAKQCGTCKINLTDENSSKTANVCRKCKQEYDKEYHFKNKDKAKQRYLDNLEYEKAKWKKYYEENKEHLIKKGIAYSLKRRRENPAVKLKHRIGNVVRYMLKGFGGSKYGKSILDFLPYTMEQLKQHLESLFEPWMTWENHGRYELKYWNDNDKSTWTWQIDHKIPQTEFPYKSMEEENFQKCWALSNLQPLNSKENLLKKNKIL